MNIENNCRKVQVPTRSPCTQPYSCSSTTERIIFEISVNLSKMVKGIGAPTVGYSSLSSDPPVSSLMT